MTISPLSFQTKKKTICGWNFSCLTIFNELVPWSVLSGHTQQFNCSVQFYRLQQELKYQMITCKNRYCPWLVSFFSVICTKHNKRKSSVDWTWNTKMRHTQSSWSWMNFNGSWFTVALFFRASLHSSVDKTAMIVKQLNAWMFAVYICSIWICWNRMLKTLICTEKKKRVFLVSFCEWRLARVRQYNNNNIHAYPHNKQPEIIIRFRF